MTAYMLSSNTQIELGFLPARQQCLPVLFSSPRVCLMSRVQMRSAGLRRR